MGRSFRPYQPDGDLSCAAGDDPVVRLFRFRHVAATALDGAALPAARERARTALAEKGTW
jgi:hypothetical protein